MQREMSPEVMKDRFKEQDKIAILWLDETKMFGQVGERGFPGTSLERRPPAFGLQ